MSLKKDSSSIEDKVFSAKSLRLFYELIVAANVAIVLRLADAQRPFWPVYYIDRLEGVWEFKIEKYMYTHSHPNSQFAVMDANGHIAFLLLTLGMALCIFLFLRLIASTAFARELLHSVAGVVSILAFPIVAFYRISLYPWSPEFLIPSRLWLIAEILTAVSGVILFSFRKWKLSHWKIFVLLSLHHLFWGWVFLGVWRFWLVPFRSIYPVAALCSSLMWDSTFHARLRDREPFQLMRSTG